MATNEYIQSVLAKAISNVGYIRTLEGSQDENAALIGTLSNGRTQYDLEGITKFSAFISKVQHNFLWYDYPVSFGLLHKHALEIDVFTAYLPSYQENKKNTSLNRNEKIERFITFLKTFLSSKKSKKHQTILYAVEHEDSIRRLKEQGKNSEKIKLSRPKLISPGSIVKINGFFHIHHFSITPDDIAGSASSGKNITFSRRKGIYVYWIDAQKKDLKIITITKEVEAVLHFINDSNTVADIVRKCGRTIGSDSASDVLLLLFKHKIIYLK